MARNGSGTYSLPIGNPVITGTTISSTWANNTLTDIANALTGSLAADGQTTASGNLNMGTYKITNAGDPTNPQDVSTKYYVDQLIAALGTMAYQDANDVLITGGAISNVDLNLSSKTNEVYLPKGPTSLRTASPVTGILRYNTTENFYEGYTGGVWVRFQTFPQGVYTFSYLIVAGGGGASSGGSFGAGAGGGGFIASSLSVNPGTTYTMVIGAGGAGGATGTNSSITGVAIASGGGRGAATQTAGGVGGSGGGGGSGAGDPTLFGVGGAGISGQGNAGGNGATFASGGGGGGGAVGGSASGDVSGAGGTGYLSTITGSNVYYAGGGGGGSGNPGGGGAGGGGAGNASGSGGNGSANTGGGGGGGNAGASSSGGSGVIILSVPTVSYSGTTTGSPTITISGANTILKFTTSGTYTA